MRHPAIERLLILQDRDAKRQSLETQLKAIPRDIAAVEQKIAADKASIEAARKELKDLEVQKKSLETEIHAGEEKLAKYRTQQLSVRKNDEYQALGHEIENAVAAIGVLEEKELAVMFSIDEAKKRFVDAEAGFKREISGHEARIKDLNEREKNLQVEHSQTLEEVAAARAPIDVPSLRLYDRIAVRGLPACVAVSAGRCHGCHLKISSEIESAARKGDQLATCDQCGRIVYWEA